MPPTPPANNERHDFYSTPARWRTFTSDVFAITGSISTPVAHMETASGSYSIIPGHTPPKIAIRRRYRVRIRHKHFRLFSLMSDGLERSDVLFGICIRCGRRWLEVVLQFIPFVVSRLTFSAVYTLFLLYDRSRNVFLSNVW